MLWSGKVRVVVGGAGISTTNAVTSALDVTVNGSSTVAVRNVSTDQSCLCCVGGIGIVARTNAETSEGAVPSRVIDSAVSLAGPATVLVEDWIAPVASDAVYIGGVGVALANATTAAGAISVSVLADARVIVNRVAGTFNVVVFGVGFAVGRNATLGAVGKISLAQRALVQVSHCALAISDVGSSGIGAVGYALGATGGPVSVLDRVSLMIAIADQVLLRVRNCSFAISPPASLGSAFPVTGALVIGAGVAGSMVAWAASSVTIDLRVSSSTVAVSNNTTASPGIAAVVGGAGMACWRADDALPLLASELPLHMPVRASPTTFIIVQDTSIADIDLSIKEPVLASSSSQVYSPQNGSVVVAGVGVASWISVADADSMQSLVTCDSVVQLRSSSISASLAVSVPLLATAHAAAGGNAKLVVAGLVGGVGSASRGCNTGVGSFVSLVGSVVDAQTRWLDDVATAVGEADMRVNTVAMSARFKTLAVVGVGFVALPNYNLSTGSAANNASGGFNSTAVEVTGTSRVTGRVLPARTAGRSLAADAGLIGFVAPPSIPFADGTLVAHDSVFDCGSGPCLRLPAVGGLSSPKYNVDTELFASEFTACDPAPDAGLLAFAEDLSYRFTLYGVTARVWRPAHPANVDISSGGVALLPCVHGGWTPTAGRSETTVSGSQPSSSQTVTRSASSSDSHSPYEASTWSGSASSSTTLSASVPSTGTLSCTPQSSNLTATHSWRSATPSHSPTVTAPTSSASQTTTRSWGSGTSSQSPAATSLTPSSTASETVRPPPPGPKPPLRDGVVIAGTGLGVIVQFAIRGSGPALGALRASGISSTLRRIGTADGCRGQDPAAAPEWLNSPLQLGMSDGGDFVTGTAVGAPFVVVLAIVLGAFVGVTAHLFDACVWAPLGKFVRRRYRARLPAAIAGTKDAVDAASIAAAPRPPPRRSMRLFTAAAGGAANLMIAGSALVSQPAVAAAVLRLAEGPARDGADGSYAAGALICAVLSFALPMVALHVAWPSRRPTTPSEEGSTTKAPTTRVQALTVYENCNRRERVRAASAFLPGGLRQWRHSYLDDVGYWCDATPDTMASSPEACPSVESTACDGGSDRPHPPTVGGLLGPEYVPASPQALADSPFDLLAVLPVSTPAPLPHGIQCDGPLLPPDVLPTVQTAANRQRRQRVLTRAVADACGVAWREALYGEYRGHARLVAQFVVASQALQGLAQAAGELVPRDVPDSAWWSCVASSASQLFVMALCTVMLLWTQPHRTRQNFDAEILPTALQAGICVPVALLAARRWTPNETLVAGLDAALDVSAMLQPLLGAALALFEVVSQVDFDTVYAAARLNWHRKTSVL
jgi:hypothetical protein